MCFKKLLEEDKDFAVKVFKRILEENEEFARRSYESFKKDMANENIVFNDIKCYT